MYLTQGTASAVSPAVAANHLQRKRRVAAKRWASRYESATKAANAQSAANGKKSRIKILGLV